MENQKSSKNRFDSLPNKDKVEILSRYVSKYKGDNPEALIDLALLTGTAGEIVMNSNIQF
jgi:hypothetical protein